MAPRKRSAKSNVKKSETARKPVDSKVVLEALKKSYGREQTRELLESLLLEGDKEAKRAKNVKGKKSSLKQAGVAAIKRPPRLDLYDKLDDFLREARVPAHRHEDLKQWFMSKVHAVLENEHQPKLPDAAPELWRKGQGEKALAFLSRVYLPYLEARVLTYTWLSEHDYPLYQAVKAAARRVKPEDGQLLPLTESEVLDIEYKRAADLYGQEELERIHTLMSTLKHREHRQRKKINSVEEYGLSQF